MCNRRTSGGKEGLLNHLTGGRRGRRQSLPRAESGDSWHSAESGPMEDIQEHNYSKCDRYGEISNPRLSGTFLHDRFDRESFAKRLLKQKSIDETDTETRRARHQHSHHHHSIQELIHHFGQKLGSWRRNSCGDKDSNLLEDFRTRSRSLGAAPPSQLLPIDDCGTTYRIYDTILREGNFKYLHILLIMLIDSVEQERCSQSGLSRYDSELNICIFITY